MSWKALPKSCHGVSPTIILQSNNQLQSSNSYLLAKDARLSAQSACDCQGDALPVFGFSGQLAFAGCRELVIFGAAIVLRIVPTRNQPSLFFQPVQRRIERTRPNIKSTPRNLVYAPGEAKPMIVFHLQGIQNQ